MDPHDDFAALRNLLALKRLETPMDTEVDRFLIEFHRRQRAQLLVPQSRMRQALSWMRETAAGLGIVPSLSYASAVAAIALAAFLGLSQQVQVTQSPSGQYKLSLLNPSRDASLAMIPGSFGNTSLAARKSSAPASTTFGANRDATTRFVLASAHPGYDSTATF
jgi:hypothetical protein